VRYIDGPEVWRRLPMKRAVDVLEQAITSVGIPPAPPRSGLEEDGQLLLLMPAMSGGWGGAKLITLDPQNPDRGLPLLHGAYTIFEPPGLTPAATIEGRALTELRTAAVSGLATRLLARPDAKHVVIVGAGAQGRSHLLAMAAVLDEIEDVRIVARSPHSAESFVEFAEGKVEVPVVAGRPEDVAEADVVCLCTSSSEPVIEGTLLPPGVHVNAIGAYRPDMREVDEVGVTRSRVVVETREAALAEKGELLQAEAAGVWHRDDIVADLPQLLRDGKQGRTRPDDLTLFASVGVAFEDLVVARAIVTSNQR
jgi:ornithine cyclodeaminase/alanine dehydrogenase-like protein (mu-crystallin family)